MCRSRCGVPRASSLLRPSGSHHVAHLLESTPNAQVVTIDKRVKLMDCPGIVFARARSAEEEADVMLRNCVRVEKMEDPQAPVEAMLRRVPAEQLQGHFGIARFADVSEFLTLVALKRGKLGKGGAADADGAARAVLQDWNAGLIAYHSKPPKQAAKVRAGMGSARTCLAENAGGKGGALHNHGQCRYWLWTKILDAAPPVTDARGASTGTPSGIFR